MLYSTSEKLDIQDFSFTISTVPGKEKKIIYDKFLGLWKNEQGKYELGCRYDPNGIEVPYALPDDPDARRFIPADMSQENGQNINPLIDLLVLFDETQMHEQLMRYYWNIWMGEDIYDVDIDGLLNLFNTNVFIPIGTIYGNSVEEKVWFALVDAFGSEYAAAGAMGNIWRESGFKTNNLQNTYEARLGSDEEYTAKVDDGTYTNFIHDSAGYGLCQWTFWNRKEGLYNYAKDKEVSISDVNMQIEYLLAELGVTNSASNRATIQTAQGGHSKDTWLNSASASEAAEAFYYFFEGPGSDDTSLGIRQDKAEYYYKQYKGKKKPEFTSDTVQGGNYIFPWYIQGNYLDRFGTDNIKNAGCGPSSLAIILAGMLGDASITPPSFVAALDQYYNHDYTKYYQTGVGSKAEIYNSNFIKQTYGLTVQTLGSRDWTSAQAALDSGYCVLAGEKGHILALVPPSKEMQAQGYKVQIIDPSSWRNHGGVFKSMSEAEAYIKKDTRFSNNYLNVKAIIKP